MPPSASSEKTVHVSVFQTYDYTWTYKSKRGDDKVTSRLRYKDQFEGWLTRVPEEGSEHPDIAGLYLVDIDMAREEGGLIAVVLDYETFDYEIDLPGRRRSTKSQEKFWMTGTTSDEPILTFPKFEALAEVEQKALSEYLNSKRDNAAYDKCFFDMDSPDSFEFLKAIFAGQDAWRTKQIIWHRRRTVKNLSDIPFDKIGKIDEPPSDGQGNPETPEGCNWQYLAPDVDESVDGQYFQMVEHWQLSYSGGFNPFFYGPTE